MTIDQYVQAAREHFAEIDGSISELRAHAADLKEQIDSASGFDVFRAKKVAALKLELEETREMLNQAETQRRGMTTDFWKGNHFSPHQYKTDLTEQLTEKYAAERQAVADNMTALLDSMRRLDELEQEETHRAIDEVKKIYPYVDRQTKNNLSTMTSYWNPFRRSLDDAKLERIRQVIEQYRR